MPTAPTAANAKHRMIEIRKQRPALPYGCTIALPGPIPPTDSREEAMFSVAPSLMSGATVAFAARRVKAASWLHLQDFEIDAAFDLGILRNQRLRRPMLSVERRILR